MSDNDDPEPQATSGYDQTIKYHGTESEQIAYKLGTSGVQDQDLSSLGDWFASRRNPPLDNLSAIADFNCEATRETAGREPEDGDKGKDKGGEELKDKESTQVHDFLKHITISRDQTKERKSLEEQLALQALLEGNSELSLEALSNNLRRRTWGPRGVHTDEGTQLSGIDQRETVDTPEDILKVISWIERTGPVSFPSSTPLGNFIDKPLPVSERKFHTLAMKDLDKQGQVSDKDRTSFPDPWDADSSANDLLNELLEHGDIPELPHIARTMARQSRDRSSQESLSGSSESSQSSGSMSSRPRRSSKRPSADEPSRRHQHDQIVRDSRASRVKNNPSIDKVDVRHQIEELTAKLESLKGRLGEDSEPPSNDDAKPWRTIYRIKSNPYLGKPEWMHGDREIKLGASMPVISISDYLARHPELLFLVFEDYAKDTYEDSHTSTSEFHTLDVPPPPIPDSESIFIASKDMRQAVEALVETYPDFYAIFPDYDFSEEIPAPYLFLFHMFPEWEEKVTQLEISDQECVNALLEYLQDVFVPIYEDTIAALASGKVTGKHIPFLVKPGDILVQLGVVPQGFMATSWVKTLGTFHDQKANTSSRHKGRDGGSRRRRGTSNRKDDHGKGGSKIDKDKASGTKASYRVWNVTGWNWVINGGRLYKNDVTLELHADSSSTKIFNVNELAWFPLRYASDGIKNLLLERGHKFWRCRSMQFVGYAPLTDDDGALENANERFMIDFATYRKMHPESKKSTYNAEERDFDANMMIKENPPEDETINLFPSTVTGYNLRLKKWVDVEVDRIRKVNWNKKAFENLVVDEETKHLVKALISNQIKAEKSTDLISGKGNGLIMLLHGGPGTGKTFTAESVAELAEKPLYRVTCGDIGTKPEDVEQYLESVLLLVVLLDEADVFLEERSLTDLKRNALVSVFLRILEYYDGILILTSNRVGTFDQAFKSRIQLALHYEKLTMPQRRKIWRNFFNRLKDLGEPAIDFDDLYDHIGDLAEHDMNGRQIRNSITTARQLAQFECKEFSYTQLKHAIKVAGKFEGYLTGVNQGFSDDQLARDNGFR